MPTTTTTTKRLAALSFILISLLDVVFSSSYSLTLHDRLVFQWELNLGQRILNARVTYSPLPSDDDDPKDWVAIGFTPSNLGDFIGADFCVFWADWKGNIFLQDVHTGQNDSIVRLDRNQDCGNFKVEASPAANEISWMFSRRFDTCHDNEDYVIEEGTTHLVWSFGKGPLYELEGLDLTDPDSAFDHGFNRVRLLKVDVPIDMAADSKTLDVRHQVTIPSDNTTYWCSIHKLPEKFSLKHHVVQYEPIISPGNDRFIHHMEVFHCVPANDDEDDQFPIWQGPCGSDEAPEKLKRCKKVLAAWAIGAGPFTYPKETGLAIGGPKFSPFVMLEVHLNNEEEEAGVRDSSGLRFLVTETLRPHDAGIMELGLIYTDRMAIPPGQYMFPLDGYCLPACTAVGFPSEGITLFGSQLHTHGTGLRVATRHFRNGEELPEVNRDNHYSTHFQEIRTLREPRLILPGDELITTCWYDTRKKANATVGGFTFEDEMCLNYIHYYPRTEDLEICKSSVDTDALGTYFQFLNEWDGQITDPDELSVRENYLAIRWTKLRAEKLRKFYNSAPIEMQCTSGAGTPLPGKWSGMGHPDIRQILPPPARPACKADDDQQRLEDLVSSDPEAGRDLEDERDRFRKRFWTEEERRKRPQLKKRAEARKKKWMGRQFELKKKKKKRSESFTTEPDEDQEEQLHTAKELEDFLTMAKRIGRPVNEMKKKKKREDEGDDDDDLIKYKKKKKRSEEVLDERKKKAGQPFNEMKKKKKKRSESVVDRKRRKRVPASTDSVREISRLEAELDRASDLLDRVVAAAAGKDVPEKNRKRRKRVVPVDAEQAEEMEQDLKSQIDEVYELLRQLGVKAEDFGNDATAAVGDADLNGVKKKRDSEEYDEDDEWSDYDSWGVDLIKRGLGSMKKKKRSDVSVDDVNVDADDDDDLADISI